MKVTNYILKSNRVNFFERFILPDSRGRMNELISTMEERGYEPLQPIGKDGCWWIEDLGYYADRAFDQYDMGAGFGKFLNDLEKNPLNEGETRTYEYEGSVMTVIADCSDLSNDGLITNDFEPVGLDSSNLDCPIEDRLVRAEQFANEVSVSGLTGYHDCRKFENDVREVIYELIERIRELEKKVK